jgi:hypothetical protein
MHDSLGMSGCTVRHHPEGLDFHRYICNGWFGLETLNVPDPAFTHSGAFGHTSGLGTRRARSAIGLPADDEEDEGEDETGDGEDVEGDS